uniref:Uncharacterized protein n=1 Tax=Gibberella zeae (strain ATCC MYA-4620 / CBS 123657 / FGSC 9075 / NRRL 31084 / PH-1) TaxID=229533 RepID=A0A098DP01_GIBZE
MVTWIRLIPGKPPLRPQETTVWVFTAYLKGKAAWSRVFDPSSGRAQDQAVLPSRSSCLAFQVCCGGRGRRSLTDHSILEKQGNLVLGLRFYMGQEGLLKPYVDNVFDSIIDRDTPDGVMYDTIKKLNELGAKWLYVKNWLNQVVLLFRYAVMVHRLCKRPWKALDLTGNSTLSRRVLGSNVDLNSHYTDGTPKDDAYMEYDLGYAAGADTVSHIQSLLIAAKPQLEPLATYMTAALLQTEEIVRAGKVMRYVFQFQAVACGLALNGETDDLAAKVIYTGVVSSPVTGRRLGEVAYVSVTLVDMETSLGALCKLREPRGNTCEVGCDRKIYYDLYLIVRIETPENTYTVRCEWDEKRNQNQEAY